MGGVAATGGAILTATAALGFDIRSNVWAAIASIVGLVIMGAPLLWALWRARPPELLDASNLVGTELEVHQLDNVYQPLPKLGVVGPVEVGKSTLVNNLRQKPAPGERTQVVRAYVTSFQTTPTRYLAIVDGGGDPLAQQFNVAAPADVLFIVLDHNLSDEEETVDRGRVNSCKYFAQQLRGYLRTERSNNPVGWVHVLMNKRDLWENAPRSDQQQIQELLEEEVAAWQNSNLTQRVTSTPYSNSYTGDVNTLLDKLIAFVQEQYG